MAMSIVLLALVVCSRAADYLAVVQRQAYPQQTNCSLIELDHTTGKTVNLGLLKACLDSDPDAGAVPQTAYNPDSESVLYISGSGRNLYSIEVFTAAETVAGTFPEKYDEPIGIGYSTQTGMAYVVTPTTLYSSDLKGGPLTPMAMGKFGSEAARVTFTPTLLVIMDGTHLTTIDLVTKHSDQVACKLQPMDLEYYSNNNTLIVLAHYQLYEVEMNGHIQKLRDIPDGDGFPAKSGLESNTFFFADFDNVYSIDLITLKTATKAPYNGDFVCGGFNPVDDDGNRV